MNLISIILKVNNNIFFVCLVILEVSVTYYTIWYFTNVLPSTCKKLSSHLISSGPILEDIFIDQCKDLIIHRSIIFTFSTLPFTVSFFNHFFYIVFNKSRKLKCYIKSVLINLIAIIHILILVFVYNL